MKQNKIYLFALLAVLSMAACGSSNDGDGNGSNEINTNKNEVTTDKAVTRLEFPKLKGGNSIIRVYRDGNSKQYDPDNVNYSVEWDCDKKSQRWSCYILTNKNRSGKTSNLREYPNDPSLTSSQRWDKDYYYGSSYGTGAHPYDTSLTMDTFVPTKIVNIVQMQLIRRTTLPTCSPNTKYSMAAIPTINIKGFGSRWRTT